MLALSANSRIFICKEPVSMRKSFEGLGAIVEEIFPGELLSGSLFVFLNRKRDHIKVLTWDRDGFVIWYKHLQKGSFAISSREDYLDRREFMMLLEGIVPKKIRPKIF